MAFFLFILHVGFVPYYDKMPILFFLVYHLNLLPGLYPEKYFQFLLFCWEPMKLRCLYHMFLIKINFYHINLQLLNILMLSIKIFWKSNFCIQKWWKMQNFDVMFGLKKVEILRYLDYHSSKQSENKFSLALFICEMSTAKSCFSLRC